MSQSAFEICGNCVHCERNYKDYKKSKCWTKGSWKFIPESGSCESFRLDPEISKTFQGLQKEGDNSNTSQRRVP